MIYLFPMKQHDRETSHKVFLKVDHSFVIKSTGALDLGLISLPCQTCKKRELTHKMPRGPTPLTSGEEKSSCFLFLLFSMENPSACQLGDLNHWFHLRPERVYRNFIPKKERHSAQGSAVLRKFHIRASVVQAGLACLQQVIVWGKML